MRRRWLAVLLALSAQALAAERVVSLAPSLSEIVAELGAADVLVGVLDGGDRPAALAQVPSVGRYGQLAAGSVSGWVSPASTGRANGIISDRHKDGSARR